MPVAAPWSAIHPVVALCGGVGGAKLVAGLADLLPADALTVVVNTADDFRRYGLHISPDLDTVLYTLARRANPATGWGLAEDTDGVMDALRSLGDDPWFHLGDRDLATHLLRTSWLAGGLSLTEVTRRLGERLRVTVPVLPMSDDPVATVVETGDGDREFQTWFVRDRCQPPATGVRYAGIELARPSAAVLAVLARARAVILSPSNPFLSLGPILALPGIRDYLRATSAAVVAVSPIVGERALKGPTAEMMRALVGAVSARTVADLYVDFLDGFVIDARDADLAAHIAPLGPSLSTCDTIMNAPRDRRRVAAATLDLAREMATDRGDGPAPPRHQGRP